MSNGADVRRTLIKYDKYRGPWQPRTGSVDGVRERMRGEEVETNSKMLSEALMQRRSERESNNKQCLGGVKGICFSKLGDSIGYLFVNGNDSIGKENPMTMKRGREENFRYEALF